MESINRWDSIRGIPNKEGFIDGNHGLGMSTETIIDKDHGLYEMEKAGIISRETI
jgi:hypothetical protein